MVARIKASIKESNSGEGKKISKELNKNINGTNLPTNDKIINILHFCGFQLKFNIHLYHQRSCKSKL